MTSRWVLHISLTWLISFVIAGCTDENKDGQEHQPGFPSTQARVLRLSRESRSAIGLTTTVAAVVPLQGTLTVPAKLVPNQDLEAQVGSLVQGRVRQVFVKVGDKVREGQDLMHIEGLEVGQIMSGFIKARADLKFAEAAYKRQKTLLEQKIGSQKIFLEAEASYDKALADFSAEDKRIHSIGLSDEDLLKLVEHASQEKNSHRGGVLPIKAPISGTVVERNVVIGQLVEASTTAFRIVNTSSLWADGQVNEKDVSMLSGRPPVSLTLTTYPGQPFRGELIFVSPVVDEQTRTVTVRASIPNGNGQLRPLMFGELHIPLGGTSTGILVPGEAVLFDNDTRYVFIATSDSTFERRAVTPGKSYDSRIEIRNGVMPGEKLVVKGAFQLKSEMAREAIEGGR